MTIREALDVSNRTVSVREAEIFLQHVLKVKREYLHAHSEQTLTQAQVDDYEKLIKQRENNEPVAYIIGKKEFYGLPFKCDKRALIPRPETESIIDLFLKHARHSSLEILELGTGCGNIALTIALELKRRKIDAEITATDISTEALALAKENQAVLVPDTKIEFLKADLFDHPKIQGPYDFILANLPYVPETWKTDPDAQRDVVFFEPDIALFGGANGLNIYREFFKQAPRFLAGNGVVIVEYNETQTAEIKTLAKRAFPDRPITVHQDYAGLDRVLEIGLPL